jgi:phosphoribosylaminoimidazole carboxylase
MPRGVPVATVAINNATNAGLLAVRMLGVGDADLLARFCLSFCLCVCVTV